MSQTFAFHITHPASRHHQTVLHHEIIDEILSHSTVGGFFFPGSVADRIQQLPLVFVTSYFPQNFNCVKRDRLLSPYPPPPGFHRRMCDTSYSGVELRKAHC